VRARGSAVACGGYRLELDEAARAAFRSAGCEPATGETALVPLGGSVEVEWFGTWYDALVLEALRDGRYRVHYADYASSHDEYVPRSRVRPPLRR
jgi:hypothetical protein